MILHVFYTMTNRWAADSCTVIHPTNIGHVDELMKARAAASHSLIHILQLIYCLLLVIVDAVCHTI